MRQIARSLRGMPSVTRIAGVFRFHAAQCGLFLGQAALGFIVTLLFLALSLLRFPLLLALLFGAKAIKFDFVGGLLLGGHRRSIAQLQEFSALGEAFRAGLPLLTNGV